MSEPPPLPPRDSFLSPDAPERAKRSPWKLPLIIVGAVFGGILMLVAAVVVFAMLAKEVPVTDQDKVVLLTAAAFEPWASDLDLDASRETFKKIRNIDKSHELDYEYEDETFFLACSVGVESSASDARISYSAMTAGVLIGSAMEDAEWRERPELMSWGDASKAALLYVDGDAPCGNLFACRKGKRTFLVLWSGIYFDTGEALRELLTPILERWESYNP